MIKVSAFTDEGIDRFLSILKEGRRNAKTRTVASYVSTDFFEKVSELSSDASYITEVTTEEILDVSIKHKTRYEMGEYLNSVLPHSAEININNIGLWSWLAAIYLKDICEYDNNKEKWKLWTEPRYIQDLDKRRSYRHLISNSVLIFREMGDEAARLFLSTELYVMGDAIEQLRSRAIDFSSVPSAVAVANKLYISSKTNRLKKGAMGWSPGSANRLVVIVLKQLSMNFDLYSLDQKKLMKLLPKEFKSWETT